MPGYPPKQPMVKTFLPVFVMVPVLMALHLAWYKMQYNNVLVSPEERNRIKTFKFLDKYKFLIGEHGTANVEEAE